jgi:hypothetical protein
MRRWSARHAATLALLCAAATLSASAQRRAPTASSPRAVEPFGFEFVALAKDLRPIDDLRIAAREPMNP